MPFEIHDQDDYFYIRLIGVVDAADLNACVLELEQLEAASPPKNRIIDLTSAERLDICFADVLAVAHRRAAQRFTAPVKSAVIARQPVEIGFGRMFQMLNDHPQIEIRVLRDVSTAIDWFR